MDTSTLRRHVPAASIFLFTLALRLTATWRLAHSAYSAPLTGDMRFYAAWAQRIAEGQLTDFHAFYGQPLYAYLLGGVFAIAGFQPVLVGVVQAIVDAATAVLIYNIAKLAFPDTLRRGEVIGGTAAIGWALFVPSIAYCGLLIPASWMVFGWWFCIWWLLARSGAARLREWLAVATFVGAVAMMSAMILFVLPLFAVGALNRKSLALVLALVAGVMLGTGPAWIHNAFVARDAVFLSAHGGLNFWIGNNPEANGYPRVPRELPSEQAALLDRSIKIAEAAAGGALPRSAVSDFWAGKARGYIRSQPADWARLMATKARNFWNWFEYDDLSSITALRDARVVPPGISFGLLAALGLPGLILGCRSRSTRYIAAAVLLQMFALLPVFVNERYRMAAAPGLLLLGTFFLVHLWNVVALRRWLSAGLAVVLVGLGAAFVTLSPGDRTLRSLDDYKTARRHIIAGRHDLGEIRMRRAFAAVLGTQHLAPAIANGFLETAEEQLYDGDRRGALATLEAGLRINPAGDRLRQRQQQIALGDASSE